MIEPNNNKLRAALADAKARQQTNRGPWLKGYLAGLRDLRTVWVGAEDEALRREVDLWLGRVK